MNKILLLIIVSSICGGSVYPLIKIAEAYEIPKFAYIFWESLFVTMLLGGLSILKKEFSFLKAAEWKYYGFCALTNILVPQTLFFVIAANMPASVISLVVATTPMLVYATLLVCFGERFSSTKMISLCLGLIGLIFLFYPSLLTTNITFTWQWLLFSLSVPAVYTLNRIYVTSLQPADAPPYRLAMGLFATVCLVSGLCMIFTADIYIPFVTFHYGDIALLAHAIFMTIFYICFFVISKHGSVKNSLSFYLAPLVGTGWGAIFFSEEITIFFVIAMACIFAALYLINKKDA